MHLLALAAAAATLIAGAAYAAPATATAPAAADTAILNTLRKEHPRLFITADDLQRIKTQIKTDPALQAVYAAMKIRADKILADDKNRVSYTIVGPRLLTESRRNLHNISILALTYRISGEPKYRDLAIDQMLTAAKFKNWNPTHFLDTAEMTTAMAIGYDWLHDDLTPAQRTTIKNAIVNHGLNEGMKCYRGQVPYGWWTKATHNWSQVCNGGMAVGALAIADEEPQLAANVLNHGLKAVQGAMAHFDIDGGWDEGPGYWAYTTQYTAYYIAALQSALGDMHGLDKTPGLNNAGAFRMHFIGPTGKNFNFADAKDGRGSPSQMFFFSRLYNRPEYAWHHRQEPLDHAFDLLWFDSRGESPTQMKIPTAKRFRAIDVAFMRSNWEDPNATWVGFKGGDNGANHSHLDLGCFVIDSMGKRFVMDLGPDDYNMPGYFGKERWTYYRLATPGQNTLLINNANQPPKAKAPLIAFSEENQSAVADLSAAYPMTKLTLRGMRLVPLKNGRAAVLLQDEITAEKPVAIESAFHTEAQVTIAPDKRSATLALGDKKLNVHILAGEGAILESEPLKLDPPQRPAKGITKVRVKLPEKTAQTRLLLIFTPAEVPPVAQERLETWPGRLTP